MNIFYILFRVFIYTFFSILLLKFANFESLTKIIFSFFWIIFFIISFEIILKKIKFKNFFKDVFFLYKIFFSWLIIKIISIFSAILLWIILIIPNIILTLIYIHFNWIDINSISFVSPTLSENFWLNVFLIINYILFIIWFFYWFFFLARYYNEILKEWKNVWLKYLKKIFDFSMFKKYFKANTFFLIFWSMILGIWIIFMFFIQSFAFIKNSVWLAEWWNYNFFFIILSLFSFCLVFGIFYLIYRFAFCYAFLIDEEISVRKSLKKSFEKTSGIKKFIKTILIIFIFLTFYFPFQLVEKNLEKEKENIENFIVLSKYESSGKVLEAEYKNIYNQLNLKYWWDTNEIYNKYLTIDQIIKILNIVYIILFFGISSMIYISIYRNIIK